MWNGDYYILKQGIATGTKHAVPLANILLSCIVIDMKNNNSELGNLFDSSVKLWKRFIDDGVGVFKGSIDDFLSFFFDYFKSHFVNLILKSHVILIPILYLRLVQFQQSEISISPSLMLRCTRKTVRYIAESIERTHPLQVT